MLLGPGVSRISADDPTIKQWVAAVKACRMGQLLRGMGCERQRIPFIQPNSAGHMKGEPLPEKLDRLEMIGKSFHLFPPAEHVAPIRAWAEDWKLTAGPVARLAVHLGLSGR